MTLLPYVREAGRGPPVLCLHSNASNSGQWRALMDRLSPTHRVLAADAYGAGRSPQWPHDRALTLADEAALLGPVFVSVGEPVVLVGHSYGAAVALLAAIANPDGIKALALYEPPLGAWIDADSPPPNQADGLRAAAADAATAVDAGHCEAGAERFIDYWMGDGSWARMPASRQAPIAASVVHVRRWAHALFSEPTPISALAALDLPVLLMSGGRSTPAAHAVTRLLAAALPKAERLDFATLGHMAPVTDPEPVNDALVAWLKRVG